MSAMRPGAPDDVPELVRLYRADAAAGRRDSVPTGAFFDRILSGFDWAERSRVVDGPRGLRAAVLVAERPTREGAVVRVDAFGEDEAAARLLRWGVLLGRATGCAAVQVWRRRGDGDGLEALGLHHARPFWRMDRPDLERVAIVAGPPGYRFVDRRQGAADSQWLAAYEESFAEHWRHTSMDPGVFAARQESAEFPPECDLLALGPGDEPAALVLGGIVDYGTGDGRAQPVGLVNIVGTVPGHRRRGLAAWLLSMQLARLREAGGASASLYVDGLNPTRAYDVYRRAGFAVAFEMEVWETS